MTTIWYTIRDMAGYEPCRCCGIDAPDVLPFFPDGVGMHLRSWSRPSPDSSRTIDWLCMACMCSALLSRLTLQTLPIEPTPRDQFWWALLIVYEHTPIAAS